MRSKKFTICALLIMIFIFLQSALPADLSSTESGVIVGWIMEHFGAALYLSEGTVIFAVRKTAHFMEYLVLGSCLLSAVREWRPEGTGQIDMTSLIREGLLSWGIAAAYAVSDEVHQIYVPGRSCELRDVVIDSCGALLGIVLTALAIRFRANDEAK